MPRHGFGSPSAADFARPNAPKVRMLHLNESPYPPSPKAVAAAREIASSLNRYPDSQGKVLAQALAVRTGIAPARILFGCGSDELIHDFCTFAVSAGDHAVVPAPTFPSFATEVRIQGATPIRVRLDAHGANDAAGLVAAVTDRTRLVFCCTPNPPSGGMVSAAGIETLAKGVPDTVLLIVDEAYHEYGRHAGGPDVLPILAKRRGPWAVMRTFSKAYGLAGARLGYALCGSEAVAEALRKVKLHFGATATAQAAALAALEDDAYLNKVVAAVARERERLGDGLRQLGLDVFPSAANFVSAVLPILAATAVEELKRRRILVRDWRDPEHLQEIRITVGLPDDTDAVVAALRDILGQAAA
ncbi:MAG TPA: aminotransferase class I/II-fold pyridoxal phosphate-dependent enzyme [Stellaceae bacterium]|nr:aminotransferase class I/II-fold pyridoxal phosphate-dependent enzyme [Stellaceae bacterium]